MTDLRSKLWCLIDEHYVPARMATFVPKRSADYLNRVARVKEIRAKIDALLDEQGADDDHPDTGTLIWIQSIMRGWRDYSGDAVRLSNLLADIESAIDLALEAARQAVRW